MKRVHRSTGTVDVSLLQVLLLHPPAACADRQPSPQLDVKKGVKSDAVRAVHVVRKEDKHAAKALAKEREKLIKEKEKVAKEKDKARKMQKKAKGAAASAEEHAADAKRAKAEASKAKADAQHEAAEAKKRGSGGGGSGGKKGTGKWRMVDDGDAAVRLGGR